VTRPVGPFAITAILLLVAGPIHAGAGPAAINARDTVVVDDAVVRLGDLFTLTGPQAATPVTGAPPPGRAVAFDARTLLKVALAHGIDWRPETGRERVRVERESRIVSAERIERLIGEALGRQGRDMNALTVELANPLMSINLPATGSAQVVVEEVSTDPAGRQFTALLAIPTESGAVQRIAVNGRLHRTAEVPVLVRPLGRDEVITDDNIRWIRIKDTRLGGNTVVDEGSLVGLSARRALRAGTPIRASQVRKPVVVAKGSLVTLVLRGPGLVLTARGRALEEGGQGDVIRVGNSQSHIVVEATVEDAGHVTVQLPGQPVREEAP
jgi:flagella basal body P-ring formation protein FlgA